MLSKNEVKYIQSLGHKKRRQEERLFIAEGSKMVAEFVKEKPELVSRLYATEEFFQQHPEVGDFSAKTLVTAEELQRISQLQTANEALAVVHYLPVKHIDVIKTGQALVLDGIRDPGNMGTIIRLADWFGIDTIVCSPDCADIYNPKVVQATMGSIMRVDIIEKELPEFLQMQTLPVIGAILGGEELSSFTFPKDALVVIGSEANGIAKAVYPFLTQKLTIPKFGEAESLNAAIATGIFLWEMKR